MALHETYKTLFTVKQQQLFLYHIGYFYTGAIDGIKGSGTIAGIKAFQKAVGLKDDGVWGNDTNSEAAYYTSLIQKIVGSTVDGIPGIDTINKIGTYQSKHGLKDDKIAGVDTLGKMDIKIEAGSWSKIKHFQKSEFRCPCGKCNGYPVQPNARLARKLDAIRDYYDKPIQITSGVRCSYQNKKVGGVSNSVHLKGGAADFYISGKTATESGRHAVERLAVAFGAAYSYSGTSGMGNAVHMNI